MVGISPEEFAAVLRQTDPAAHIIETSGTFAVRATYDGTGYRVFFHNFLGDKSRATKAEVINFVSQVRVNESDDPAYLSEVATNLNRQSLLLKCVPNPDFISIEMPTIIGTDPAAHSAAAIRAWHQSLVSAITALQQL